MPKSVPLRAIATTMREPGMSRAASAAALPAGIDRLRKKWSLPEMNANTSAARADRLGGLEQVRGDLAQQQRGRRTVAVVALVAHLQRLRDEHRHVDRAVPAQRPGQRGREHPLHPAQPVDDLGRVGAEAQHLAEPLVQRAVGAAAVHGVLEHRHRHRRAHHAGHRPDGAARVARRERDAAGGGQPLGLLDGVGQALVDDGAEQRTAHGSRRAAPRSSAARRAGTPAARGRARRAPGRRRPSAAGPSSTGGRTRRWPPRRGGPRRWRPGRSAVPATGGAQSTASDSAACWAMASSNSGTPAVTTTGRLVQVERDHRFAPSTRFTAALAAAALDRWTLGAGRDEGRGRRVPVLRVAARADQGDDDGEVAAVRGGPSRGRGGSRARTPTPGRRAIRSRARCRAAARRSRDRPPPAAIRSSRSDGSIIGCARPWVSRSSPKSIITCPAACRSGPSAHSGSSGVLDSDRHAERVGGDRHRLVAQRAAGEESRMCAGASLPGPYGAGHAVGSAAGAPRATSTSSRDRAEVALPAARRTRPASACPCAAAAARTRSATAGPAAWRARRPARCPGACRAAPSRPAWTGRRPRPTGHGRRCRARR